MGPERWTPAQSRNRQKLWLVQRRVTRKKWPFRMPHFLEREVVGHRRVFLELDKKGCPMEGGSVEGHSLSGRHWPSRAQ